MTRVAFYKAPGDWTDKAVRWWTHGPYSHCELVIDNIWLSASPREGKVRFKDILPDNSKWDFVDIELSEEQINHIIVWVGGELGCGYDWMGIALTQIVNLNMQDPERWFCSELVVAALQQAGKLHGVIPHQVDPNELCRMLTRNRL